MSFEATLRHEVGGHGFGRFADEYIYYDEELPSTSGSYNAATLAAWQGIGQYLNVSLANVTDQAPSNWQPFLADPETYPEVGFFEGAWHLCQRHLACRAEQYHEQQRALLQRPAGVLHL